MNIEICSEGAARPLFVDSKIPFHSLDNAATFAANFEFSVKIVLWNSSATIRLFFISK
jgi:hypothetical protein